MKRLSLIGMLMFGLGLHGVSQAQSANMELSLFGDVTIYVPANYDTIDFLNSYNTGFGGGVRGIFELDSNLGLGATVGYKKVEGSLTYYSYPSHAISAIYPVNINLIECLSSLKLDIGNNKNFWPYVLGGLGTAFLLKDYGIMELHPLVQVGVGCEFSVWNRVDFFVEAKENAVVIMDVSFGAPGGGANDSFTYTSFDAGFVLKL